jgi:hypothetical protein
LRQFLFPRQLSDSAIDLSEAEDVLDNFGYRGFGGSQKIRLAFFPCGETPRGERWPYFSKSGATLPAVFEKNHRKKMKA